MANAMRSQLIEVYSQERSAPCDCSVVVPVYNGTPFLGKSIPAVLGQTDVVCDIVISDDCSSDGSLEAVLGLVRPYTGPHSIRVFRTSKPAPSEHIPLLVAVSRCDRIIQAHQDDVSYPGRARVLTTALSGDVKLVTSIARLRTASSVTEPSAEAVKSLRENNRFESYLMGGQGVMGGARYGMHRDIFDRFPVLSWDHLSSGQDILLHIRAHILGSCRVIYYPLLTIGDHPDRISHSLFDKQSQVTWDADFALRRIVILSVALGDLEFACNAGSVDVKRAKKIARKLRKARGAFVKELVKGRELAIQQGFRLSWTRSNVRPD